MRKNDDIFLVQKFFACKVCYKTCNLSAFYGSKHISVVYKTTAGNVQNADTVFHHFKGACVDHSLCVVCLWNMDSDVVTVLVDIFKCFRMLNIVIKAPCSVNRKEWVITDYVHSEFDSCVSNHCTDCTKTDYTKSLSLDFRSNELALSFFCQVRDFISLTSKTVCPCVCINCRTT